MIGCTCGGHETTSLTACHCTACHFTFIDDNAFQAHRDENGTCRTNGLKKLRGLWSCPEDIARHEMFWARAEKARSGRQGEAE